MIIFLDDSLGFKELLPELEKKFDSYSFKEVPTQLKATDEDLHTYLAAKKPFWRRRIKTTPYTLEEQIQFFIDKLDEYKRECAKSQDNRDQNQGEESKVVLYFYDSTITDWELVRRVKNLIYPEHILIPIYLNQNRAILLYFMYEVLSKIQSKALPPTSVHIELEKKKVLESSDQFIISNRLKPWKRKMKIWKLYSQKKKDRYFLLKVNQNGGKKKLSKGTFAEVIAAFEEQHSGEKSFAVTKQKETDEHVEQFSTHISLSDHTLPSKVSYVHIVCRRTDTFN
ncbi:hypothetical protein GCM10008968_34930 [Bacillus horti]